MNSQSSGELQDLIKPEIFKGGGGVVAAMSTRKGGISGEPFGMNLSFRVGDREENVRRNRELFFGRLGIPVRNLAIPGQVHSDQVSVVDAPGEYPERDGLVTATRGVALVVSVADCVPVLLFDPVLPAIGAIHAGWRGSAAAIVRRGVELMRECWGVDPARLRAFIGPSASSCCYQVGEDVAARFPETCVRRDGSAAMVDLKRANTEHLLDMGVSGENIEVSPLCTIINSAFHSYRRDGDRSGRMMAVISLL